MSQRRTLILIAAIAIGALASFLVWNYVGGIQDQAYSDAERVKVFLVKQPIPRGTSGNVAQASIVEESIPRKFKPANAIESLEDISGQVARSDLVANQVVVQDMFVEAGDPDARLSFADNIAKIQNEDQATFTINLEQTRGVAGLIVPGDYVNIMITPLEEVSTSGPADGEAATANEPGDLGTTQARYVYQKVQVLAVGATTVQTGDSAAATGESEGAAPAEVSTGLITLIVTPQAAQILASLPPQSLYFSMVGKDYEPVPMDVYDLGTLPAEDSSQLTPYGPDGARKSD